MHPSVNPLELLETQRALRDRMLQKSTRATVPAGRDLAAELLLYLDEPQRCWRTCLERLLALTGADRVDGGYARSADIHYQPAMEATRGELVMASVLGQAMDAHDPAIAAVWSAPRALVFADVRTDARIGPAMRALLLASGTRRKLAVALRDAGQDVGLLCVDAGHTLGHWSAQDCEQLDHVAREVIAPIFNAVRRLGGGEHPQAALQGAAQAAAQGAARSVGLGLGLTPAELRVARLVVTGCSYKEMARCLGRSPSTIDHQLRSLRQKLGVHSNARLVRELLGLLPTL